MLYSVGFSCWSIRVFICRLKDYIYWKSSVNWYGCHGIYCSEYLQCLLYNPVALPDAFPLPYPLWLPPSEPLTPLDEGYILDQVYSGLWILRRVYLQVVVHLECRVWVDGLLTSSSIAIQEHLLNSHQDGLGRSQPAGGKTASGNCSSFSIIGWYYW